MQLCYGVGEDWFYIRPLSPWTACITAINAHYNGFAIKKGNSRIHKPHRIGMPKFIRCEKYLLIVG